MSKAIQNLIAAAERAEMMLDRASRGVGTGEWPGCNVLGTQGRELRAAIAAVKSEAEKKQPYTGPYGDCTCCPYTGDAAYCPLHDSRDRVTGKSK